jgi:NAD-dependent oxidoreductase involved in siderophore biosynthesis
MGSLAFAAAARLVWQVSRHPADPDQRTLLMVKSNLPPAVQGSTGLIYRITHEGDMTWSQAGAELDADEVESSEAEPEALSEAVEFLRSTLTLEGSPAEQVVQSAERVGISSRTLRRAKRLIGVRSSKAEDCRHGAWMWHLPAA